MKKIILLLFFTLVYSQEGISQNTFFIGEKTYACTETYRLEKAFTSKSNLGVVFIKDGEKGMIAVTTDAHLGSRRIKGKLMIYLDNNTIITCLDRNKFDIVNDEATTIYYLTKDEINKLQNSNISSIRYTVGCVNCGGAPDFPKNYSVSNEAEDFGFHKKEKINFPSIIEELFDY